MPDGFDMESPLFGFTPDSAAADSPGVIIRALDFRGKLAVQARPGNGDASTAIGKALSCETPARHSILVPDGRLMATAPGAWMLILNEPGTAAAATRLRTAFAGVPHALTDVSGAQQMLQVLGTEARSLLQMGCPIDLDESVFLPGQVASSLYERFSITIIRAEKADDGFFVLVPRSFAWAFMGYLIEQGAFLGVAYEKGLGQMALPT